MECILHIYGNKSEPLQAWISRFNTYEFHHPHHSRYFSRICEKIPQINSNFLSFMGVSINLLLVGYISKFQIDIFQSSDQLECTFLNFLPKPRLKYDETCSSITRILNIPLAIFRCPDYGEYFMTAF